MSRFQEGCCFLRSLKHEIIEASYLFPLGTRKKEAFVTVLLIYMLFATIPDEQHVCRPKICTWHHIKRRYGTLLT